MKFFGLILEKPFEYLIYSNLKDSLNKIQIYNKRNKINWKLLLNIILWTNIKYIKYYYFINHHYEITFYWTEEQVFLNISLVN